MPSRIEQDESASSSGLPRWHRILLGIVMVAYALLTLTGTTTSSIGTRFLTVDRAHDLNLLGSPQLIRSDEYNVGTPIQLSMLATGGAPSLSPLGAEASLVHRYPVGPFQTLAFWDVLPYHLSGIVPDAMLFATHWWLPSLLVLVCMPSWMHAMGGSRSMGWLAGVLVVLAPSNFWWSLQPTQQTAYILTGCTALLSAGRRLESGQRLMPALLVAVGGICIAGMPSNYLLWSLLLGGGILLATTVRVLAAGSKAQIIALVATGVLAAGLGAGVLWEGRAGLEALGSTLYPGHRRSSAAALDAGQVFGAPLLSALAAGDPAESNASELSSAYSVALLLIPFAWVMSTTRVRSRARAGEIALAAWGGLWLLWAFVSLGDLGEMIPIASSVPPVRAAQSIGIIGTTALCLALSSARRSDTGIALLGASTAALATVRAGSVLEAGPLPGLNVLMVWIAGALVGLIAFLLLHEGRLRPWVRMTGPILATVCAVLVVASASPLQAGLGDLRGSATAEHLRAEGAAARAEGSLWVTDDSDVDVIMLANGVPSLSGLQRSGPDVEFWERLDPDHDFEVAWNRGGGYSAFGFEPGAQPRVETDGFDYIRTVVDPCDLIELVPEVTHVVSENDLSASTCLSPTETFRWSGKTYTTYTAESTS